MQTCYRCQSSNMITMPTFITDPSVECSDCGFAYHFSEHHDYEYSLTMGGYNLCWQYFEGHERFQVWFYNQTGWELEAVMINANIPFTITKEKLEVLINFS